MLTDVLTKFKISLCCYFLFEGIYMSSFAVFTDKDYEGFFIDVHFNLWNQSYDDNYLDIGVMSHNFVDSQKLYVWLPFKIDDSRIYDLTDSLEDINVVNAIFNENYVLQREGNSKWIYLSRGGDTKFKIYLLDLSKDIVIIDSESLGFTKNEITSILEVNVNLERVDEVPIYFRFRVRLPEITDIIHEYSKPYQHIRGAFLKNYVIDFRYNDKRSFSASENELINKKYFLSKTNKLHFLLMTKVYVDVECSIDVRKRRLEPNIWRKYVLNNDTTDIIAYHATKKVDYDGDIGSWEFFAKQTVETKNWLLLLGFVVITVFFGAFGSFLGNHIDEFFRYLFTRIFGVQ